MSYLTEEQPLCDWCRLLLTLRGHAEDDIALAHSRGNLVVLIDGMEVERYSEIPTECLCGRNV